MIRVGSSECFLFGFATVCGSWTTAPCVESINVHPDLRPCRGDKREKQLKRHRENVLQINIKSVLSRHLLPRMECKGCNAMHIIGNRNELRQCFATMLTWVCNVSLQHVMYRPLCRSYGILIKRGCSGRWNGGWKTRSESCVRKW